MDNTRCLFVSIIGEPNAGKSTLLNAIVGEKVSIISHKAQTTRRKIRGIANFGNSQIVFTDTPGFCIDSRVRSSLDEIVSSNFWNSFRDSDLILLLIDATSKSLRSTFSFLEKMKKGTDSLVVAINKVDIARKENLLKIANSLIEFDFIKKVFMISAKTNDGIEDLIAFLIENTVEEPWFFGENQTTDADVKFMLSEITREKLFLVLEQELPYSIYVETEALTETEKKARIHQSIVVLKDSQKAIVLGHSGGMIKSIKDAAITDMKKLLNKKVELKLFVKVREKWTEKKGYLQDAGIIDH
ncbi:MAG: GTPase Era [Holosporales bacterium]|jgi:GTP-binding protein Era|nr:GTPase Era [Holosporales bacterium]